MAHSSRGRPSVSARRTPSATVGAHPSRARRGPHAAESASPRAGATGCTQRARVSGSAGRSADAEPTEASGGSWTSGAGPAAASSVATIGAILVKRATGEWRMARGYGIGAHAAIAPPRSVWQRVGQDPGREEGPRSPRVGQFGFALCREMRSARRAARSRSGTSAGSRPAGGWRRRGALQQGFERRVVHPVVEQGLAGGRVGGPRARSGPAHIGPRLGIDVPIEGLAVPVRPSSPRSRPRRCG